MYQLCGLVVITLDFGSEDWGSIPLSDFSIFFQFFVHSEPSVAFGRTRGKQGPWKFKNIDRLRAFLLNASLRHPTAS